MQEFDYREFDDLCYTQRKRIRSLPLNLQYSETILYKGRVYHYDPDYDCFYPQVDSQNLSHWDRYNWIYVTLVLTVIAYCVSP